jgi:hypothetical protein
LKRNKRNYSKYSKNYEHLFDLALGEFNMAPISLQLIDPGPKPVHSRTYKVIRQVELQLRKEIARLVEVGVLEEDYTSEWASPIFARPRRTEPSELFLRSEN